MLIDNPSKRALPYLGSKKNFEGWKKGGKSLVNGKSKGSGRQKIDMGWGKEVFG